MGKATEAERKTIQNTDPNLRRYGKAFDPRSAHEVLQERLAANLKKREQAESKERATKKKSRSSNRQSSTEAFIKSMARSLGSTTG